MRGLTICRGQGPVDWSPVEIWRCMSFPKFKQEWDINNDGVKFCKKVGVNAYIYYSKLKSKSVLASRDFVVNYICNMEADGSLVVACSSYNCDFELRSKDGIVRGDIAIGGLLIEPVKGNPK